MKRFFSVLFSVLFVVCMPRLSTADNLRMGETKVVASNNEAADISVKFTWSNSWRDKNNYDAVYIFGKFRNRPVEGWHHMFWSTDVSAYNVPTGYSISIMNGGRGIMVFRTGEGAGQAEVTLTLRWMLAGNVGNAVTRDAVLSGAVPYSVQGMEMVYVPTAPFYAGDGLSTGTFASSNFGILPAQYDVIGTNSNFAYSSNGTESGRANVAANHVNRGTFISSSRQDWCGTAFPAWWMVDFGSSPKRILYFGVSGVFGDRYNAGPASTWYLEGSNDNSQWNAVWSGGPEFWGESTESYPIQKAIRVSSPGTYRYYRIRVNETRNAGVWNNIRISNVAMTEVDLATIEEHGPVMVDGLLSPLPAAYPNGVYGFYAMKYELTQEQYVTFLNQLPRPAQYGRTIGGYLDKLHEGEYVFGDNRTTASHRNGIIMHERNINSGLPYVFACNLNPADLPNGQADGQTVACNYLSVADMLSYAEWTGLRPISEMEYEKMCRGKYPSLPTAGEYAWEGTDATKMTSFTSGGTENEGIPGSSANINININADNSGTVKGPVRVGLFSRGNKRNVTGNSFFGISDLSGNLSEIYCDATLYGRQLKRSVNGSGEVEENGDARVADSNWPRRVEAYGVRGGDWNSALTYARVSDRSRMSGFLTDMNERHPETGVRLGISWDPTSVTSVLTLESGRSN